MPDLNDFIADAQNTLDALKRLIEGDAAETPIPDTSVSYTIPAIAYDSNNEAWILTQSAADTNDNLYKGIFILTLSTGCATLTIVNHNVVTPDDNIPARYQACSGNSLVDVASMAALNDKQIIKLEIRSKQPFSVSIKLSESWCATFNFALSDGGWQASTFPSHYPAFGNYVLGTGWETVQTYPNGSTTYYYDSIDIYLNFPAITVTSIEYVFDLTNGGYKDGARRPTIYAFNGGSVAVDTGLFGAWANGNNQVRSWSGSQTLTSIRLRIDASDSGGTHGSGQALIKSVTIQGLGSNPFGENNCG